MKSAPYPCFPDLDDSLALVKKLVLGVASQPFSAVLKDFPACPHRYPRPEPPYSLSGDLVQL